MRGLDSGRSSNTDPSLSLSQSIAARTIISHLLERGAIGAVTTHDLALADTPALAAAARAVHFTEIVEPGHDDVDDFCALGLEAIERLADDADVREFRIAAHHELHDEQVRAEGNGSEGERSARPWWT